MSKKELLEDFKAGVLARPLLDQSLHNVMHYFHEACHFFFREIFSLGEVAVEVCELLQNGDLSTLLHSAVKFLNYASMVKPRLTNLLALSV